MFPLKALQKRVHFVRSVRRSSQALPPQPLGLHRHPLHLLVAGLHVHAVPCLKTWGALVWLQQHLAQYRKLPIQPRLRKTKTQRGWMWPRRLQKALVDGVPPPLARLWAPKVALHWAL